MFSQFRKNNSKLEKIFSQSPNTVTASNFIFNEQTDVPNTPPMDVKTYTLGNVVLNKMILGESG